MEGFCCIVVVGIIVAVVISIVKGTQGGESQGPSPEQLQREETLRRLQAEKERQEKALQAEQRMIDESYSRKQQEEQQIHNHITGFNSTANSCFGFVHSLCYPAGQIRLYTTRYPSAIYNQLMEHIKAIRKLAVRADGLGKYKNQIKEMENEANLLNEFMLAMERVPLPFMFDKDNYGIINQDYWKQISSLSEERANDIVETYFAICQNRSQHDKLQSIDITLVLQCIWFYTLCKPFDVNKLNRAWDLFSMLYGKEIPDIFIADIYAIKNLAADDLVREKVKKIISSISNSKISPTSNSDFLITVASGLMWMGAYNAENEVLSHILKSGQPMSEKAQERLHTLSTSGGKAPVAHEVDINEEDLYFDVSSLTWKDDEYEGLFNNLAFRGTEMSYSLAVRDQNNNVSIPLGYPAPTLKDMLAKFKNSFFEEYDDIVTVKIKNCVALSGNNKEPMQCIQVKSKECEQMRILVHITRIGRNLNIKIYTLFSPIGNEIANQKQQALSLYHELSPSVKGWEDSIKETILFAIQQLLNQPQNVNSNNNLNGDDPIF